MTKSVQNQIKLPVDHALDDANDMIKGRAVRMMDDGDIAGIADWLIAEEQDIDETRGGLRGYQTLIEAALFNPTLQMIETGELDPPKSLDKTVIPFEEALGKKPGHPGLAALTALRHLQAGWAFRGSGFVHEITDAQWEKVGEHYGRAAEILSEFDAEALRSPALAMAKHKLLAIEGASSRLDAAFDLWRTLDPMSSHMFMCHAFHCLPRWGGSYEKILVDARRLAGETSERWGMAAYALYLIQLSDGEPEVFEHMDLELFEEGVHDLLARRSEPPVVNFWLRELNEMASATPVFTEVTKDGARLADMAAPLRDYVIRTHLTVLDPTMWEDGISLPLALVANAFKDNVQAGDIIALGDTGCLCPQSPAPLPD
ncbi:MAG: hypothetical protein AAF222_02240 [Pseudomonadota bacterium]